MRALLPFLKLYRRYIFSMTLGVILSIVTLLASIALLTLSGWFLAASALAGIMALTTFNYLLPAAGVRGSAIIRTAARYFERLVNHNVTFKILTRLRVYAFSRLLPLTPAKITQFNRAELLNRLIADIDTLDHLYLRLIVPLISAVIVIATLSIGLSLIHPQLALTLGSILFVLLFTLPLLFYKKGKSHGSAINLSRSQYRQKLVSWLQGHAELAIFSALTRFRHSLDSTEKEWLIHQQKQSHLTALSQATMLFFSGLTFTAILWLASDDLQLSALIALFVFASLAAFEALSPIPAAFLHISQVETSAQRVGQLLEQQPEVTFLSDGLNCASQVDLSIEQLNFCYPKQQNRVLNSINLNIKSGQRIAILGKTGCGKSTLIQLITRAWEPQSGSIQINDHKLCEYSEEALRQMVAIVPQRTHLFNTTLRQNLLIAKPNASDDELISVLQKVELTKLLDEQGLNNWLGDGGRQLSGGELRRIGLARAILRNAPLIILDEPTEGLDHETEGQILDLIQQHSQGKALLMITHRLTGLERFDNIYIMDNGSIIESGNHLQLLEQKRYYWQLQQQ